MHARDSPNGIGILPIVVAAIADNIATRERITVMRTKRFPALAWSSSIKSSLAGACMISDSFIYCAYLLKSGFFMVREQQRGFPLTWIIQQIERLPSSFLCHKQVFDSSHLCDQVTMKTT